MRHHLQTGLNATAAVALAMLLGACGGGEEAASAHGTSHAPAVAAEATSAASVASAARAEDVAGAARVDDDRKTRLALSSGDGPRPATGWYWNPNEGGTGFMFEAQGNLGFVAFFMYEEQTGKPIWYAATGELTSNADGSVSFQGDMRLHSNGQAFTSPVYRPPTSRSIGSVRMDFTNGSATAQFPGGRVMQAVRFDFAGLGSVPTSTQPETGWYWNPEEGGRGYAIEVQNNQLFMAIFHYGSDGSPTWHTVRGDIGSGTVTGTLQLYSGGQTLTSAFRPGGTLYERGSYTVSFRNRCAGQVQRAGAPAVSIRRYVFAELIPGSECKTITEGIADVPAPVLGSAAVMQPGDIMYGMVENADDLDGYGIELQAGTTYRFDLRGFGYGNGTLFDPILQLYDAQMKKLAEDDDGGGGLDASITFKPSTSGIYHLAARGYQSLTGSFLLTANGIASRLAAQPVPSRSSYAGTYTGSYNGRAEGAISLSIDPQGVVTGRTAPAVTAQIPMQLSGTVAAGGEVRVTGYGYQGAVSFVGFVGPQGDLTGSWNDASGSGGLFMTGR